MPVQIADLTHRVGRIQFTIEGLGSTEVTEADAAELLETLARILDYSLVDREERRSLHELANEVYAADGEAFASSADASIRFSKLAGALADAVKDTLGATEE